MIKNKVSENTVDNIIEVSYKLFVEKGYEKSSIQDIINELGVSKGAIYHHFKSKEEILYAVLNREQEKNNIFLDSIISKIEGYSVKEKLTKILNKLITNNDINTTNRFLINLSNNSKVIVETIIQTVNKDSLKFYKLIQEGVEDGSLETDFPKECSELLLLLCNIWLNPVLFNRTHEETINRIKFIQFTMKQLGVDVIDDMLIKNIENNLRGISINEINKW